MTKLEIAKVQALRRCKIGRGSPPAQFVIALGYMVDQKIMRMLSQGQKFYLDQLIWNFRAQLAGLSASDPLGFELPDLPPEREEYIPKRRSGQESLGL